MGLGEGHSRLGALAGGWVSDVLVRVLPDEDVWWDVSVCAHPAVPPPTHLCALVYVSVPSLARLGGRIAHATIIPLDQVGLVPVTQATEQLLTRLMTLRREELANAQGPGADGAGLPPGMPPLPGMQWPPR